MTRAHRCILLGVTHARSFRLMAGLAERLVYEGWDVHVVSDGGFQSSVYADTSITVHRISMMRQPAFREDIRALRAWVKLTRELRPDVIFVGTPKAGLLGSLAAWLTRVPERIYHQRGLRLESEKGVRRIALWIFEKIASSASTRIIAVSDSLRRAVIKNKLARSNKITVLAKGSSNGVDTSRFHPDIKRQNELIEPEIRPDVPVIGVVGRITKDKGSSELVEASSLLRQRGVDHQLLIIGPEEDTGMTEYMRRVGGQNGLVFTGVVADTAPYYKLMDLLCLPTHREGFPNVVLEAGASGKATVTTDATGAIDSVVDNLTGRIVPVGDYKELADVLAYLLLNPQERERMGREARRYVVENFSRESVQDELLNYLAFAQSS